MTIEIRDINGKPVLWTLLNGKAALLPLEKIYIRAGDGHVFVGGDGQELSRHLARLRPHEPALVEFWLDQQGGEITPNVFAGEPAVDG
jgi:hypothetical protein